ncbi:ATP-binding cassette domain-containing protein [Mycetocola spongiae]|uniref:ATP-binding cassette domain-containing protein n=1 Tax=Mycetocola spongiae TaxID=2859226 RepID=UPI001CF0FE2F|nr:ATP-binding cassette domain-containing protein [Mycetocola spongiae]UCR88062.1 ATP-binding cassette domain-containing protein [Mycetocola spongiae]
MSPAPSATLPPPVPVLDLQHISKSFGPVHALRDVSLTIYPGEVVALVGDNGAGKSTLIKTISGAHPRDNGTMRVGGEDVSPRNPLDSTRLGIATVYQDLALCDNLDIVSNLFLGREDNALGFLQPLKMEQVAMELLTRLSVKISDIRVPVSSLSGGQRQSVAIARSLLGNPRLVVLDEPTAALGVEQTAEVLELIERLRAEGHAVLMISHNLGDVFDVADRIVCLRLGQSVASFTVGEVTEEQVVAAITGIHDSNAQKRRTRRAGKELS